MKKFTISAAALALALVLCACSASGGKGGSGDALPVEGNLLKITSADDFSAGKLEGLKVDETVGDGALVLEDGATEGTFTSAEYSVTEFELMVASWNAAIEKTATVEVQARAYIVGTLSGKDQKDWTSYLTWGQFGPGVLRAGNSDRENAENHGPNGWAYMDEDTFSVLGSTSGGTKLQMKAILRRDNAADPSPVLRQVNATIKNTNSGKEITPTYAEVPFDGELPASALVTAPAYSQIIRDPDIGGSICSPTTMTMLLNSRGLDLIPEELALNIFDFGNGIFGSWSYTVSGGALYGFETYAQYADENILMQELAKGNSLGLSVRYATGQSDQYYLEGAYGDTSGHLISIIGYEYEAGHEGDKEYLYFFSGDSYSPNDMTTYHRYSWKQLSKCWPSRIAYVVPSQTPEAEATGVARIDAVLESTGNGAYTLKAGDQTVDLTNFTTDKTHTAGRGVIAYTVDGVKTDMMSGQLARKYSVIYSKPMQVTANNTFYYKNFTLNDGGISFDPAKLLTEAGVPAGETRTITFYFINNVGQMYIATLAG